MNPDRFKMSVIRQISIRGSLLLIALIVLVSCDRQKKMRGYDYIPDMVYSKAYDTYSNNPNFKDSMTMRVPVEGTMPRGYVPFRYALDTISRHKAGLELVNPYQPYDEVIARGKLIYTTFCIGCHGDLGKGDGQLFSSGLYPLKPRDISAAPTARRPDGEIFHTITLGFGSMMPHGAQIKPEDRWKVVLYVRTLQNAAKGDTTTTKGK
jgi:mono/diheme cytochrome c family protein